jgi:hypothetical protein
MYARKKVCVLKVEPEDRDLERAVLETAESLEDQAALEKDLPLIQGALATDLVILSRDDAARRLYLRAAKQVARLRPITWANPVTDRGLMAWLRREAEIPSQLKLGEDDPV